MMATRILIANAFVMLLALGAPGAAPVPQQHPAYLHALSDLRDARAHLERPNGGALQQQEQDAIAEIDRAIHEIKAASIDDGKDIKDHVPVDEHLPWGGRLHKALQLLDKAYSDVSKEEDDPAARGLKRRAQEHIHLARRHVQEAIAVVH
jgi:hypothetical protein